MANMNTIINATGGGVETCPETAERGIGFYQVTDIQKMMGVSRASAYALVKNTKGFPHIMVGNRIVIPADLFKDWVVNTAFSRR